MNFFILIITLFLSINSIIAMETTDLVTKNYPITGKHYITVVNDTEYSLDIFHQNKTPGIMEYYEKNPDKPHSFAYTLKSKESIQFPLETIDKRPPYKHHPLQSSSLILQELLDKDPVLNEQYKNMNCISTYTYGPLKFKTYTRNFLNDEDTITFYCLLGKSALQTKQKSIDEK